MPKKSKKPAYPQFPNYIPRPGGAEYRTVSERTLEGIKEAERLHRNGWATGSIGLFTTQFWRPKNKKDRE